VTLTEAAQRSENNFGMKRSSDLVIACALLGFSLPLMAIVALAIWLQGGGPVLIRETRRASDGRRIDVLKFRTTVEGHRTSVGRFLYYTRIIDLPQLMNVLRGDMSIFDPAGVRPDFFD
jgi:lipopolysaccharide/colanic/teichoic acid biosynthesis glycosyltransferase